jgi:hypothetical protein
MHYSLGMIIGTWLAGFFTLAILSFLYKDNPFYKFAEHVYVGVSAGYWVIYVWGFDVWPMLVQRWRDEAGLEQWILLVPGALGVIMLSRWFSKIAWVSRWPIAFTVGVGAGLGITGNLQGFVVPQIGATLLPVTGWNLVSLNNLVLVVGVVATILYFYFSKAHKGVLGVSARIGIIFIMISFGASFGYTLMARISLLIGRLYFLLADLLHVTH